MAARKEGDEEQVEREAKTETVTLVVPGALTPVSWSPPSDLSFDDWLNGMKEFDKVRGWQWWIGDMLNYGHDKYEHRYEEASKKLGRSPGTLTNWAYIARTFEVSRRNETLSWQHHVEVASLSPDEADEWLVKAEAQGWSSRDLRDLVKAEAQGWSSRDLRDAVRRERAIEPDEASKERTTRLAKPKHVTRTNDSKAIHYADKLLNLLWYGNLDRSNADLMAEVVQLSDEIGKWLKQHGSQAA